MIKIYSDLLLEIESYTEQIEFAEETKGKLEKLLNIRAPKDMKAMGYDNIGGSGTRNDITLDRLEPIYNYTCKRIETYTGVLEDLKAYQNMIQSNLAMCKDLQYRVYYAHVIEGLTLQEVADKLGYDYQYIVNINCNIRKMIINDK